MNEAYKDVRRLKMTLKTLEITWAEACCPPYTDASRTEGNMPSGRYARFGNCPEHGRRQGQKEKFNEERM